MKIDPCTFSNHFENVYQAFKIAEMVKQARKEIGLTQEETVPLTLALGN